MGIITKRNEYFDVLRGFGILCVVLGHVLNEKFGNIETEIVRKFIYTYHLPLFFFISGYFTKKDSFFNFIKRKIKTLYLPCLLISMFSLLLIPVWVKFGALKQPDIYTLQHKVIQILCFKADGFFIGACWFFPLLFISVIIFELILQTENDLIISFVSLVEGILGIIFINYGILKVRNINIALAMQPFLFIGYIVKKKRYKLKQNSLFLGVIFAIIILTLNRLTGYQTELSKGMIYGNGILFYPLAFMGIYFSCVCAKLINAHKIRQVFIYLGNHSNIIMMLHFIAFKFVDIILSFFMFGSIENTILGFPKFRFIYLTMGIVIPLIIDILIKVCKNVIDRWLVRLDG